MISSQDTNHYEPLEEKLNIATHALGLLLSIAALVLLIIKSIGYDDVLLVVSFSVFGASLIALYAASVFYHRAVEPMLRSRLRIVDHAAIYVLIAGTYTPFALITLSGSLGWFIFSLSWSMAILGIVLKLYFIGQFDALSTLMYVAMGWLIIFFFKPLLAALSLFGVYWLVAGGVAYTVGAVLYSIDRIRFNHAIFHVFVLLGSICHFISVYFYVLPK